MKKLLSLLGSVAIVGGSSATIVACGAKPKAAPKENPIEVAKTKLKNLIEEAKGLVSTSRKGMVVTERLQTAIDKAQQVLDKPEVSEAQLTNETATLQTAIDEFKRAEDKEPIVIAKELLQSKIKEAETLVAASKKEVEVTKDLQTAIDEAKMALNDPKATETSITDATKKLTQAIDKFNQAKDLNQQLQEKIDETKKNKAEIENKNNENGWNAIAAKSQTDFESVIAEAEATVQKDKLTKEEVNQQFVKLDNAIESFKLTLPQAIVSKAINLRQDNIKDLVAKDWSYSSFFDAKAEQKDRNARLVNILVNDVSGLASKNGYTSDEQVKLSELIVKYFAEKVKLVYLNEQDGQQKIKSVIENINGDMGLEQIFHNCVKDEFPEADLTDSGFWKEHSKLSLGILFETNNLNPETKEFWSFSFIGNISKEDKDEVQRLFREAEMREGGWIILDIPVGLRKKDGTLVETINSKIQKKVFYGKRYIFNLSTNWIDLPNDEQLKDGIMGWTSKQNIRLMVMVPGTSFFVDVNYKINIS